SKGYIDYRSGMCLEIEEVDVSIHWTISDLGEDRESGLSDCVSAVVVEPTRCISCVPVEEVYSGLVTRDRDG
ncbi:hypothetical protein A2U01_0078607, partial [Trifolium medium]|nr:hypothetical protein [Trifolium medium]